MPLSHKPLPQVYFTVLPSSGRKVIDPLLPAPGNM